MVKAFCHTLWQQNEGFHTQMNPYDSHLKDTSQAATTKVRKLLLFDLRPFHKCLKQGNKQGLPFCSKQAVLHRAELNAMLWSDHTVTMQLTGQNKLQINTALDLCSSLHCQMYDCQSILKRVDPLLKIEWLAEKQHVMVSLGVAQDSA